MAKAEADKRTKEIIYIGLVAFAIGICLLTSWGVRVRIDIRSSTPSPDVDTTMAYVLSASQTVGAPLTQTALIEGTATPYLTSSPTRDRLLQYADYATEQAERGNPIDETTFPQALTQIYSTP